VTQEFTYDGRYTKMAESANNLDICDCDGTLTGSSNREIDSNKQGCFFGRSALSLLHHSCSYTFIHKQGV